MAEIVPLRAWRYADELNDQIEQLTAPLFDVVSQKQRQALYQNPFNSIHLSVPPGDSPSDYVREKVKDWKSSGIITQDSKPGIYVYYQYFYLKGSPDLLCRKGFIANLRLYDWDDSNNQLLRHENTMPHSVDDRIEVLDASQLNISPTHGLYTDTDRTVEKYLDQAMLSPLYEAEDYQGARDVLAVIHDRKIIQEIIELMSEKKVILADGHHRYEGSLVYKQSRESTNPNHNGAEGYNYHLMYFTNTESGDFRILPTHRLIGGLENFKTQTFLSALGKYFHIKEQDNAVDLEDSIAGRRHTFGLVLKDHAYRIALKDGLAESISWKFPEMIKNLDLTVLHFFILEKVLGILGKQQRNSKRLTFERSFAKCLESVNDGTAQIALITNEITIDEVKKVCASGYTLPQKATYFFPKVICGFLFGSIAEEEFHTNY